MSSKNKIIIIGIFLILLVSLSLIYLFVPKLEIKLNGENNINLLLGEEYEEQGAIAFLNNIFQEKEIDVKINGNVNNQKVGNYIITYEAKSFNVHKEIIRVVNVVDNTKPEIVLNKKVIGCQKNNLVEYDAKATDDYDGDITDKLTYQVDGDELKLTVVDSSNNKSELKSKIEFIDHEKPTLQLNEDDHIYLIQGEEYIEYGATSHDSCDGDITKNIEIINSVDTNVPGEYNVVYKTIDSANVEVSLTRRVTVLEKTDLFTKVDNVGTIYLTFDDGPGMYTEEILNVLDGYGIKATFFVTNQFPKYRHLIKKEYELGHTIGIHTYSHKWSIYESVDTYLEDFNRISDVVYAEIGIKPKLFRFPGGSSNVVSRKYSVGIMKKLTKQMEEKGFIYFDWTFDSGDTNKKNNSSEAIIQNFQKHLKSDGNYVVLMHDIKKNTLEALPEIIRHAKSAGYSFAILTEETPALHFKVLN